MKYDPEYREMFPSACPVSDKYPATFSGDCFGDTTRNYWFLYEGTPAGTFALQEQFWGTNSDGHRLDAPLSGSEQTVRGDPRHIGTALPAGDTTVLKEMAHQRRNISGPGGKPNPIARISRCRILNESQFG